VVGFKVDLLMQVNHITEKDIYSKRDVDRFKDGTRGGVDLNNWRTSLVICMVLQSQI
jgi:hypothetical protein